jgi:TonB-dependent receptor
MDAIKRVLATSLIGLCFPGALALAASINGRVRDANTKAYLLGATVTLQELGRTTSTNADGSFTLSGVPAGNHTVQVSYLGYDDVSQSVAVTSDADVRADFSVGREVVNLGAFVVEGTREGQARALQQKRSAVNITDIVSADAVGKFPDGNAAEALRRIPGVSLEIDQAEGRFVVVRGIDAALNNVTLNGMTIGSPAEQGARGLSMDTVPADLISRLEVTKAVTPDLDHNAIGGSINIVTQSVFDRPDGFFYGSLNTAYTDFRGDWDWYGGSATYGRVLDKAQKWGVVAGFSYSSRKFGSNSSDDEAWTARNGVYSPTSQASFNYNLRRQRLGLNTKLEFRPGAAHQLYVQLNYNEFHDDEDRQSSAYEFARGTLTNATSTGGNWSAGRATREFRDYKQNHLIDAYSVGGKHGLDRGLELEWKAGLSTGERETPRRVDWEFRSADNLANSFRLGGDIPIVTPTAAFYNPASYPFRRVRFRQDDEREDIYSAQVDLRRQQNFGLKPGFWKVGAKLVNSQKHQDRTNTNYNLAGGAANLFTLAEPGLTADEPSTFAEGRYRLGPVIEITNINKYFRDNPGRFAFDAASSLSNSRDADFDAEEEIMSGYAMASVDLSRQLTLVGGLRVERTDAEYSASERRNGVYFPISVPKRYTQALPGLHLVYRPNNRLVFRAAWTNTYGRAPYTQLAPRNVLDDIDLGGGIFQGSLSSGNPQAKPFESMNFDAGVEYYLKNAGILSVAAFHKSIDNPVYTNSYQLTNTTYGGRNYSILNVSRPENARKGEVTGVEFNWQQFFHFLPSPLNGLGVNLNYTIVDSSASIFGRTGDLPFFKQSDDVGNFALVYEKYGFEARIAYAINSAYLISVGNNPETDIYIDRRRVIDAKASYRINRRLKVFVELLNLTKEPLREFQGQPGRNSVLEVYSWNANVGINWSL